MSSAGLIRGSIQGVDCPVELGNDGMDIDDDRRVTSNANALLYASLVKGRVDLQFYVFYKIRKSGGIVYTLNPQQFVEFLQNIL